MCGLTGFWNFQERQSADELTHQARSMAMAIQERGPDSFGVWVDQGAGIALGHRRLSIVDLSEAGAQPMVSHSDRLVIAYNGEVYNADQIRRELSAKGCQFRGHSDTEVIIEACEHWGVETAVQKLIGMFAFVIWDKQSNILTLVRDRLGIKPLYYGFQEGVFYFGSQLKSFHAHSSFRPQIDKEALTSYFRFNYVPAPLSIYKGIEKCMPGTIVTINADRVVRKKAFWQLTMESLSQGQSDEKYIEELEVLLKDAVKKRMIADVPLGAFLSGGIDSSLVVALMQAQNEQPVKTFSIGFHEEGYNEATHAAEVAKHLGTDHHELYLTDQQAQQFIPQIPQFYDEPFADVSQIPTYLVSKMAREKVTVALSGDGGDESFAGYNRYLSGYSIWRWIQWMPQGLREIMSQVIQGVRPGLWDGFAKLLPSSVCPAHLSDKAYKFADVMKMKDGKEFYRSLVSSWQNPEQVVLGGMEAKTYPWTEEKRPALRHFIEQMQFWDTLTYLPDDILTKVDRASMAVSLEARVPLLDHRVVEYAARLPLSMKIREGKSKWLLRQVLYRYVPSKLVDRPKMGFGVPIGQWMRGALKEWTEDLLSESYLTQQGLLDPKIISTYWQEHLSGERNWQSQLWGVLMFQAWYQQYGKG